MTKKIPLSYGHIFPTATAEEIDQADRFLFGRTPPPNIKDFHLHSGGSKRKGRLASNLYFAAVLTAWRKASE